MATEKKTLSIEGQTKFGVRADGVMYSYGKYVKDKTLNTGDVVEAEIYYGPSGGKYINSFVRQGKPAAVAAIPLPPSLPPTTVSETKAPGGESPIAPKKRPNENGATGVESEKMTKQDWANKDSRIETVAVLKSVLESPAFAQLAVGKREGEVLEIGSRMFTHFLDVLRAA